MFYQSDQYEISPLKLTISFRKQKYGSSSKTHHFYFSLYIFALTMKRSGQPQLQNSHFSVRLPTTNNPTERSPPAWYRCEPIERRAHANALLHHPSRARSDRRRKGLFAVTPMEGAFTHSHSTNMHTHAHYTNRRFQAEVRSQRNHHWKEAARTPTMYAS